MYEGGGGGGCGLLVDGAPADFSKTLWLNWGQETFLLEDFK